MGINTNNFIFFSILLIAVYGAIFLLIPIESKSSDVIYNPKTGKTENKIEINYLPIIISVIATIALYAIIGASLLEDKPAKILTITQILSLNDSDVLDFKAKFKIPTFLNSKNLLVDKITEINDYGIFRLAKIINDDHKIITVKLVANSDYYFSKKREYHYTSPIHSVTAEDYDIERADQVLKTKVSKDIVKQLKDIELSLQDKPDATKKLIYEELKRDKEEE